MFEKTHQKKDLINTYNQSFTNHFLETLKEHIYIPFIRIHKVEILLEIIQDLLL